MNLGGLLFKLIKKEKYVFRQRKRYVFLNEVFFFLAGKQRARLREFDDVLHGQHRRDGLAWHGAISRGYRHELHGGACQ